MALSGIRDALLASLLLAAASTLGDFVWAHWALSHRMAYGLAHGALLCAFLGLVLGVLAGEKGAIARGTLGELGVGIASAASFYLLAPFLGRAALFASWMLLWVLTGLLNRWIRRNEESLAATLLRGGSAALLSGLAFWAVSDMWLSPPPGGPDYPVFFLKWTAAFLPGFLCLLVGGGRARPGLA